MREMIESFYGETEAVAYDQRPDVIAMREHQTGRPYHEINTTGLVYGDKWYCETCGVAYPRRDPK